MSKILSRRVSTKLVAAFVLVCLLFSNIGLGGKLQTASAQEDQPQTPTTTPTPEETSEPIVGTPTATEAAAASPTEMLTFTPHVDLTPTADKLSVLDLSVAGNGSLFRAHVELKQPRDLTRLGEWGIAVLDYGSDSAFVQVDEQQLAKLARLGFQPTQIDSIDYLTSAYNALGMADGITSDELASSSTLLMELSSVDTDSDGLTDTEESYWCTDPNDNNSDSPQPPSQTNPSDGGEVQAILQGKTAYGPPFALWPPFTPHNPNGTCPDGDYDGVPDYAEEFVLGTSNLRESSDKDKFDDGQELFGVTFCPASSGPCGYGILPRAEDAAFVTANLPSWVLPPGNSPFVAAFPEPEVNVVPSSINMTAVTTITTTHTILEGEEHSYGTEKMVGTSTSLAETETWNSWQSVATNSQIVAQRLVLSPTFNFTIEAQASDYRLRWDATKIGIVAAAGAFGICAVITAGVCAAVGPLAGAIVAGTSATFMAVGDYVVNKYDTGISVPENGDYLDLDALYPDGINVDFPTNRCIEYGLPIGDPSCREAVDGLMLAGEFETLHYGGESQAPLENRHLGNGTQYGVNENNKLTIQSVYRAQFPVTTFVPTKTVTQGSEHGGARTTTTAEYEEHTISEESTNQFSESWANATAIDTAHSADLQFTYKIVNNGTEYAREITSLIFNIYIGENPNPAYSYIAVGATGQIAKIENLFPGDEQTFTSNPIPLTFSTSRKRDTRLMLNDLSRAP